MFARLVAYPAHLPPRAADPLAPAPVLVSDPSLPLQVDIVAPSPMHEQQQQPAEPAQPAPTAATAAVLAAAGACGDRQMPGMFPLQFKNKSGNGALPFVKRLRVLRHA